MPWGPEPIACSRPAVRQRMVVSALQRLPFRIVTEALEKLETYTMLVRGSTVTWAGELPVGAVGKRPWQAAVTVALQVAVLMIDTVPGESPWALMATYTVCVRSFTAIPVGLSPTVAVAAR